MKLSIAIPTFSRQDKLISVLKDIYHQIRLEDLECEIEVVVLDDSAQDLTEGEVLTPFSSVIRYIHHSHIGPQGRLGFDNATIKLVEIARGEYVQYLSDDDKLMSDFIRTLFLAVSQNPKCGVFWSNHYIADNRCYFNPFTPTIQHISASSLLTIVGRGIGFLPAYCFHRDTACKYLGESRAHVFGFCFAFLYHVLPVLIERDLMVIRNPQLINIPTSNDEIRRSVQSTGINNGYFVYCEYLPEAIFRFRKIFGLHSTYFFITKNFSQYLKGMLIGYLGGWDDPRKKVTSMIRRYWWYLPLYFLYIPLFFLPKGFLKYGYRLDRFVRKKRSTI